MSAKESSAHGGKRSGAGRKPGSKSKITREREQATAEAAKALEGVIPEAFTGDAHSLLMAVYKDPRNDIEVRIDAAKAAIRYEKPALSSVEANIEISQHEQALDELE